MSDLHNLFQKCLEENPNSTGMLEIILKNPKFLETEVLKMLLIKPVLLNETILAILLKKPDLFDAMKEHARFAVTKHDVRECTPECCPNDEDYCDDAISEDTEFEFGSEMKHFFHEIGTELFSKQKSKEMNSKEKMVQNPVTIKNKK